MGGSGVELSSHESAEAADAAAFIIAGGLRRSAPVLNRPPVVAPDTPAGRSPTQGEVLGLGGSANMQTTGGGGGARRRLA
mmetsp:Transcript_89563/g.236130  ORF Transcript_89563/g.236130 Transcript_89563/m.236130 type:complete len:80 (+) Transcript_89563:888-1127(+)